MIKIILLLVLLNLGLNSEVPNNEKIMDDIISKIYPVGDPDHLFAEDETKSKANFETYLKTLERIQNDIKKYVGDHYKGLAKNVYELAFNQVLQATKSGAEHVHSDDVNPREINKRVGEASKVRFGLMTALHETSKKDTKTTLPVLICYLKKFCEKLVAVYKDNDVLKAKVKQGADYFVGSTVQLLEKESGPGADHCELSEASSNPSQWKSISMAILEAIVNIQNNK